MGRKIVGAAKVLIVAYAITGLLLLLAAFLMFKIGLGETQVRLFVMVIYGISNIAAGFLYGKAGGSRRFLRGLLIGFLYFALLSIISFITNRGFYDDVSRAAISLVICITGGIIGAIMS